MFAKASCGHTALLVFYSALCECGKKMEAIFFKTKKNVHCLQCSQKVMSRTFSVSLLISVPFASKALFVLQYMLVIPNIRFRMTRQS